MEWIGLVAGIVVTLLWLVGWFVPIVNPSDEFDRKTYDWSDRRWFLFLLLTFFFAGPFTILITRNWLSFASFRRVFNLFSFGVSAMKRKLFTMLFLLALGGYAPNLYERAVQWWQAPPVPMSAEAQMIIDSLESEEGKWTIATSCSREGMPTLICKGIQIRPNRQSVCGYMLADVYTMDGLTDCSAVFSYRDRHTINAAAEKCLRKLTVRALETAAAQ